jgi:Flp pilus assembly protein TadD
MDCRQSLLVALGMALGSCGCVNTDKRPTPPVPDNGPEQHVVRKEPSGPKRAPQPETLVKMAAYFLDDAARVDITPARQMDLRDQARKAYQQALQIDPTSLPALTGLGRFYTQIGDFDRAGETYRKALEKHPREASLWNDLGMCMIRKKDFESAVRYLQKASELEPENRRYLPSLGFCLALTGRHDESVACLARVYGPAQAHIRVARVLVRMNRDDLARQHLHLALQMSPNLPDARTMLAQLDGGVRPAGNDSDAVVE